MWFLLKGGVRILPYPHRGGDLVLAVPRDIISDL
jgi:hypothetical protein